MVRRNKTETYNIIFVYLIVLCNNNNYYVYVLGLTISFNTVTHLLILYPHT